MYLWNCVIFVLDYFIYFFSCVGSVGALRWFVVLLASLIGPMLDRLHFFLQGTLKFDWLTISAQKPRGRQLIAKVCGCKSAIFLSFFIRPQCSTTISRKRFKYSPSFYHETDAYHSAERVHVFSWVTEYTNVPKMADKYMPLMAECCVCHYWNKIGHQNCAKNGTRI